MHNFARNVCHTSLLLVRGPVSDIVNSTGVYIHYIHTCLSSIPNESRLHAIAGIIKAIFFNRGHYTVTGTVLSFNKPHCGFVLWVTRCRYRVLHYCTRKYTFSLLLPDTSFIEKSRHNSVITPMFIDKNRFPNRKYRRNSLWHTLLDIMKIFITAENNNLNLFYYLWVIYSIWNCILTIVY